MIDKTHRLKVEALRQNLAKHTDHLLGYPVVRDFDYQELYALFGYFLNNIGDPWVDGTGNIHTKEMEREVIDFFAELLRAPKDRWGYVTNGSTEGNMYSLFVARENLPGAVVYYSNAAHYSVPKILHILGMQGVAVPTQANGELNYKDLDHLLAKRPSPEVIVVANIGTTMTEAKDDVSKIKAILKNNAVPSYHIHADAALAGTYLPLLSPRHPFDFADGADSIAISGYKFIGAPFPCGIVLIRSHLRERIGKDVPYIASLDSTLSGSRNGHGPALLWYGIRRWGKSGLRTRAKDCLQMAAHVTSKLQEIGWESWRNPLSLTVVLKTPPRAITEKWQLAVHGQSAHVLCMPGVKQENLQAFLDDMHSIANTKR
jgi:histidine decarboxylase